MSLRLPLAIRLTRRTLARSDFFCALVQEVTRASRVDAAMAFHAFALKADEHAFARSLLARRTQLWLFRTNQRVFSGDFVAVDMSSPRPETRRAFVLELKRGMHLRVDAGAVGVQLRNAGLVLRSLSREGLFAEDATWSTLAGDANEIGRHLGQAGEP
ncbi:MAG: hypothetical protein JNL79_25720 [Myxococcales bacterium]|nr:hypothetical protein [Myxococcales bacterium]